MEDHWNELTERLAEVADLRNVAGLAGWDQETYMPPGAIEARAAQLTTLERLAHERFTDDRVGELLELVEAGLDGADPDGDRARLLKVARRDFDLATRLPSSLVAALARAASLGQQAWQQARERSDFPHFRPHLEKLVELSREKAGALGYEAHPYDALLDQYEPEMTAARIDELFATLRDELVPIVEALTAEPPPEHDFLVEAYDPGAQWELGLGVIRDFGFDLERGRQDRSAHPFSTSFSVDDVRLTTRIQERWLPAALFGSLHECGHGLYEQGVDPAHERTPLAGGASLGVHESQSRLWENLVGRSRQFWGHYFPRLQEAFPAPLAGVDADAFYRAVNRVRASTIRVEADEVTYNLHVMLRFELEIGLVQGDVAVADLPDLWRARMHEFLGVTPADDAEGVLQDIHWSMGALGYFPTYTLGNLMSVQLFDRATEEIDDLPGRIGRGEFAELLAWLRENVHRHGRKFTAAELMERITGEAMSARPWLAYVRRKYGELHGIEL